MIFNIIVTMENLLGVDPKMSNWMEYKNYRKARGGHWGRWDMGHNLIMWYPTCEHFADPVPGITLLEKESYDLGKQMPPTTKAAIVENMFERRAL